MNVYLSEDIDPSSYIRLKKNMKIIKNFDHPENLDAIIIRRIHLNREIISKAINCKIIAMHGVGLDTIDIEAAKEYGIPVVNVPQEGSESVAELIITYMLMLARKIKIADNGLKEGLYNCNGPKELIGTEIHGKTVGLVGFGHISKNVAEILKAAFNCQIKVYTHHLTSDDEDLYGVKSVDSLEKLFCISDFISINIPLTDDTKNLINSDILSNANHNLILINTSRGEIVNEYDLYNALKEGKISAAGLDVSVKEPMDKNNPLLLLENFIATPHIGASTIDAKRRVGNVVVNNVLSACGIEAEV